MIQIDFDGKGKTTMRMTPVIAVAALVLAPAAYTSGQEQNRATIEPEMLDLVTQLASDPAVETAFADIESMSPQLHREMIELNEIPAPPFGEEQRGLRFADMLREAGLDDVSIDAVGNVIGRRPGRTGDRVVALAAHLDTVFPPETDVTVRVDGDTFYAPGIGDNTRGLVVLLALLRALDNAGLQTDADILFIGNVGEEGLGDLRGVKHLFRDGGPRIDSMIAIDGGRASRLVYGGIGSHRYRITFKGPGGHSWGAFGRANPLHALGRAIEKFVTDAPAVTSSGEKTSFNVGRIGGGTSVNSIPFESWMEIDMRSASQGRIDEIDAVLQKAVEKALQEENAARKEGAELTVDIERIGTRPAARGATDSALVQQAAASMRVLGIEPELRLSSSDANHPLSIGVPAITLSRGGISSNAHAPNESWQDVDSHLAVQIALLTLLAEAAR
jgi:acetylornithine deacetylase/succinyl-diaminopimelate desuccinylase-like protein